MSLIREPFTGAWQRNQEIRPDSVLAHHAVYSCITRISQDIGKLRPKLVEKDDDGIWTETSSAAFSGVLNQPNRFQNYIQFQEWWITSKLIHGNSYALIERDDRQVPRSLYLLDPTRVTVLVSSDGAVFYRLKQDNLAGLEVSEVDVPASEIVHDRMNCLFHPLVGVSPIFACGTAANLGLEIQNNSSAFFSNGSTPSGVLTSPLNITAAQAEEMQLQWNSRYGPNGPGGVAVLGNNMKFEAMTMTAVDSQLIEQLEWTAEVVCSTFHVPPFMVGIGAMPAYQSAEILNQIYYSQCLQSHIESFELVMDAALGIGERNKLDSGKIYGVELDLDGLLRMDTKAQIDALTAGVGGSLYAINEARQKLSLKPKKGGDSILSQQQYYSIEALAERDANDPFAKPTPPLPPVDPAPALPTPEPQKQLTAGRSAEETESLEMWDGWFARDSLSIVREAQALELRAVQDAIETRTVQTPAPVINVTVEAPKARSRVGKITRDIHGNSTIEVIETHSEE